MVPTDTAFAAYSAQIRQEVDAALAERIDFGSECPVELRAAIAHSLLAPGKRLRPVLVLTACEACGSNRSRALPAACAVEMIHAYSLIHDDLPAMDDDDVRRGRPSCHAAFGEATAILAGDALQARAFEVLANEVEPSSTAARCCAVLAAAAGPEALVGGQMDDLHGVAPDDSVAWLESVHARKTGALFLACLQLGGLTGGGDGQQLELLEQYGRRLGLAFQIIDDLLDVEGDATVVGKQTRKDQQRGRPTFPSLLGNEESRARAEQLIDEACAYLSPLGSAASPLEALAHYVVERNH
jgi:geranylgeranyl diphosphate synthase type II